MKTRELSPSEYADYAMRRASLPIFHHPCWVEAVTAAYGLRREFIALCDDDVIVAFPVYLRNAFGVVSMGGSPLPRIGIPPTSVAFELDPKRLGSVMDALGGFRRRRRLAHFQFALPATMGPALDALAIPYSVVDNLELSLDRPLDEIYRGVKRKGRIDRAREAGVEVRCLGGADALEGYKALLTSTYDEAQRIEQNFPEALYAELVARLSGSGLEVFAAMYEGRPVSMLWILYDSTRCYFWDGASDQQVLKDLDVNRLLHWEVMQWGHARGLKVYDLVGRAQKSGRAGLRPGIARFKKTLGATQTDYLKVERTAPAVRLGIAAYQRLLTIRSAPRRSEESDA